MKVSDQNTPIQLDAYIRQVQQHKHAEQPKLPPTGASGGLDKVELSDQARQIQHAAQEANQGSDVREDKVAQIKMDIENGTYKVVGTKVASAMLNEAFENDVILQKVNTHA